MENTLNSVSDNTYKLYLEHLLLDTNNDSVILKRCDIAEPGLKFTRCGKACVVDGLAAEQYLHADDQILDILIHGYLFT